MQRLLFSRKRRDALVEKPQQAVLHVYHESNNYVPSVENNEAKRILEEAIGVLRITLGDDHPQVAVTLWSLALCSRANGDLETARHLAKEAFRILETSIGPNHLTTKVVRSLIESVLRFQSRMLIRHDTDIPE